MSYPEPERCSSGYLLFLFPLPLKLLLHSIHPSSALYSLFFPSFYSPSPPPLSIDRMSLSHFLSNLTLHFFLSLLLLLLILLLLLLPLLLFFFFFQVFSGSRSECSSTGKGHLHEQVLHCTAVCACMLSSVQLVIYVFMSLLCV